MSAGALGCGKTLFAMEFIARGITEYGEPGVFVAFEEKTDDLKKNFLSMGFDLDDLVRKKKLVLDHIALDPSEIQETGEYDLEGLFIRLGAMIDSVGAKRVAIDTLEALFSGFGNEAILRSELRRLFLWLKDRGVTAVVTGERGDRTITKYGLEEYVADCVITLDHRIINQIATRRLRIVKYRGSIHGTDEYPFLISSDGISVLPITSMSLTHLASEERISDRYPPARHDARGKRVLPRVVHPYLRPGRDRQDEHRGDLHRCCVPAGREVPLLHLRGVREPAACGT